MSEAADAAFARGPAPAHREGAVDALAVRALALAAAELLAKAPFLSAAVGRLDLLPASLAAPLATDGQTLAYDAPQVLAAFKALGAAPVHDLAHSLAHCIFLHPFVGPGVDRALWGLASDVVAERAARSLCGDRPGQRGALVASALARIGADAGAQAGAEALYRKLKAGMWKDEREAWGRLFRSDAHDLWYVPVGAGEEGGDKTGDREGEERRTDDPDPQGREGGRPADDEGDGGDGASQATGTPMRRPANAARAKAEWRQVAEGIAVALQASGGTRAGTLSGLADELRAAARPRVRFGDFLRAFASPGEVMRLSDSDFDLGFYTYGLSVFGDTPLIEPQESREERRIREFVVAIDTSGSVFGDTVRHFVDAVFSVLKASEAFFDRVRVRVLQCDADVRAEAVLESRDDLDAWQKGFRVLGNGGTDFRPAFRHVGRLLDGGEIRRLDGLLYFTDGLGTYPERPPRYKCAFVYCGDAPDRPPCPPWAAELRLAQDEIREWRDYDLHR